MEQNCQSCGMPMAKESDFGTNVYGGRNGDYCHFCFHDGKFTQPGLTMEQMIEKVAGLAAKMDMSESEARKLAKSTIPKLKRWRTKCL